MKKPLLPAASPDSDELSAGCQELRYCPTREFPPLAYVPGVTSHSQKPLPIEHPVLWTGADDSLQSSADFLWGVDLYNHQYFWEAHEVWEELWKLTPSDSPLRKVLQGLIQYAAACLKASIHSWAACLSLSEKAGDKFAEVLGQESTRFQGLDLRRITSDFNQFRDARLKAEMIPKLVIRLPEP